jgi:hypothetical protein
MPPRESKNFILQIIPMAVGTWTAGSDERGNYTKKSGD